MKIGLTYDLKDQYLAEGYTRDEVAELDTAATIAALEQAISRLGHQPVHIGKIDRLVARLASGERWDLVFNIAEGIRGTAREAQVPGLLEAYDIPVTFAGALCLALCLDKALTKHVIRGHGIPTPGFAVIENENAPLDALNLAYPLFAKPVAEGSGLGVSAAGIIRDPGQLRSVCANLLEKHRQPVLLEEFLPGREFTVGILGTGKNAHVLGVMEVNLLDNAEQEVYSYSNKNHYEDRVKYRLTTNDAQANEAAEIALESYRTLGCRDAGRADIRCDQYGRAQFMEINPLAGLNPRDSDLPILCKLQGIDYDRLIAEIIDSAAQRMRWTNCKSLPQDQSGPR